MSAHAVLPAEVGAALRRGLVIPAHPLALTAERKLDERRQRALTRYYAAAGAGGVAVGVHTTQFSIREPRHGLLRPVLELAAETAGDCERRHGRRLVRVAGICGDTAQAVAEAGQAVELGYHVGLLSLAALGNASDAELVAHARAVGEVIPLFGFYLQPAVGGRVLGEAFWRDFAALPAVVAIKIAPFCRYRTLDVLRGVVASGRAGEIALYTGNDDHIVGDLVTPFRAENATTLRMVGGLLGHWAVWTKSAAALLAEIHGLGSDVPAELLARGASITACNAAFFDAGNGFSGCIAGIHEVLRRQGLLQGIWCLDPDEGLSPGQREAIDRVLEGYGGLGDDDFVRQHLDEWLR